ncbi:MAG TPA: hypothetical protein VGM94_02040 [Galbitalea sp.]|jgi:hypothetical protein
MVVNDFEDGHGRGRILVVGRSPFWDEDESEGSPQTHPELPAAVALEGMGSARRISKILDGRGCAQRREPSSEERPAIGAEMRQAAGIGSARAPESFICPPNVNRDILDSITLSVIVGADE